MSVLFCDLVGSTEFGARVDAESTRDVLRRYHAMAQQVIDDHDGIVVKFIGDGVMALFGVPEVAVDDAERAVAAGLDLQRGFVPIGELAHRRYDTELALRVGINTGEVVIADEDADIVGDALNTAARFEGACAPGQVLVGEETWRLTRTSIAYEKIGEIELKGKSGGVAAFRAVDEMTQLADTSTPLIGREPELTRLQDAFDSIVQAQRAQLTSVIGAPGVGKTRLAYEFERSLEGRATIIALRLERAGSTTFAPVVDLLRAVVRIETPAEDDDPEMADLVGERLRSVVEHLDDAERVASLLAGFVGLGREHSTEELFFAVRRLLEALAGDRPVALVVDDIQWAEPLFLDLLEYLSEWIREFPVMILILARPEIRDLRPALAERGRRMAEVINLDGLDAGATTDLAARLVGARSLPPDLVRRLPDSTEGNPLFVGELMRMLVDDRVIVETDSGWELRIDADAIDVPPTIQSLLSTRIERLPDDERRVVELASVVGSDFPLGAVAALGSTDPGRLLPVLERLRRRELVEPTGTYWGDEPIFRFHHVLIRDSAYRRPLKATRADLHLRAATWMEAAASGAGGEREVVVGYHLEQAHALRRQLDATGDETAAIGQRAAELLGAAAHQALTRDDVAAAGALFLRAVACADPGDEQLVELLVAGCDAQLSVGDVAAATPLLEQLENAASSDERLAAWAASLRAQLQVLTDPDGLAAAEQHAAEAADRLAALGDHPGEASARLVRARALARLGHIGDCEAELDLALAAARAADDGRRVATVLGAAPVAALWGPSSVSRAGGRCLDVIRLLRITTGSPSVEATATRCQAVLEALRGRFDTARTMLGQARSTVEELGHHRGVLETQLYSGIVELFADDPAAAEPFLRDALGGLGRLGIGADAGQAAAHLSRALLLQGRLDEAAEFALESEVLAGQNPQTAIAATTARAEILVAQGAIDDALRLAEDAVARAEGTDIVIDHANANLALARVRDAAGDADGARAARAAAEMLLRDKGASLDIGGWRPVAGPGVGSVPAGTATAASRSVTALDESSNDVAQHSWNDADARARDLLSALVARDVDGCRVLLSDGVVLVDGSEPVGGRVEGADDFISWTRRTMLRREFDAPWEVETVASRGDDIVLQRWTIGESHRPDGSSPEWLTITRWSDGLLTRVTLFDSESLVEAIVELDRAFLEHDDDRAAWFTVDGYDENYRALGAGDHKPFLAGVDDRFTLVDHRPLGWGELDMEEFGRRLSTLDDLGASSVLYVARMHESAGSVDWFESHVQVTRDGGSTQVDIQHQVVQVDSDSGLAITADQFDGSQRDQARARFDQLAGAADAGGALWNPALVVVGTVHAAARRGDRWSFRSQTSDDLVVLDASGMSLIADGSSLHDPRTARRIGFGVEHRRVIGIRGMGLVLAELRGDVDGQPFHRLAVEEVDACSRLCAVTFFDPEALAAAVLHLEQRWLQAEKPRCPEPIDLHARFVHAFSIADGAALERLLTDDFTFTDHRELGFGSGDKAWVIEAAEMNQAVGSVPVDPRYHDWDERSVLGSMMPWQVDDGELVQAGVSACSLMHARGGHVSGVEFFPDSQLAELRARLAGR